jgi:TonB family protein
MITRTADPPLDLFTLDEVAAAAGAAAADVRALAAALAVPIVRDYVGQRDAVRLVRRLTAPGARGEAVTDRPMRPRSARQSAALACSALAHAALFLALTVGAARGLLTSRHEAPALPAPAVRLVYLMAPGPGGGGGGGGMRAPDPPAPLQTRTAPPRPRVSAPIPIRTRTPPERVLHPTEPPAWYHRQPRPLDRPPVTAPQMVQVPLVAAAPPRPDSIGVPAAPASPPSTGPGNDGGVGTGRGTGTGEGTGTGLGAGRDQGAGGGAYQPGSGVDAPRLIHEVRPTYTDEARRRGVHGDVLLDVVVLRDGRVGSIRILRSLGAGLDERAIEAVRQWRFEPAHRQGVPVDVAVQIAVGFSLR